MKKIKFSEARNRTMLIAKEALKKTKGGLTAECYRQFSAACGGPGCGPGRILAELRDLGIC